MSDDTPIAAVGSPIAAVRRPIADAPALSDFSTPFEARTFAVAAIFDSARSADPCAAAPLAGGSPLRSGGPEAAKSSVTRGTLEFAGDSDSPSATVRTAAEGAGGDDSTKRPLERRYGVKSADDESENAAVRGAAADSCGGADPGNADGAGAREAAIAALAKREESGSRALCIGHSLPPFAPVGRTIDSDSSTTESSGACVALNGFVGANVAVWLRKEARKSAEAPGNAVRSPLVEGERSAETRKSAALARTADEGIRLEDKSKARETGSPVRGMEAELSTVDESTKLPDAECRRVSAGKCERSASALPGSPELPDKAVGANAVAAAFDDSTKRPDACAKEESK